MGKSVIFHSEFSSRLPLRANTNTRCNSTPSTAIEIEIAHLHLSDCDSLIHEDFLPFYVLISYNESIGALIMKVY